MNSIYTKNMTKEEKKAAKERYRKALLREIKQSRTFYLLILPFFIAFCIFVVYPVLQALWYSFTDYNVLERPHFVGFRNYKELFLEDTLFLKALQNSFIIGLCVGPGGLVLSFLVGWLINELPHKLANIFTIVFYAPSMAGGAMMIFTLLFSNDSTGYINSVLIKYNIIREPILFTTSENLAMPLVVALSLWMSLGIGFLNIVAGLQNVDEAQYEAAAIDGIKNRWQELWFITLPNMLPQLRFSALTSITGGFTAGAIGTALLGFPSPGYATHTIVNHLDDYGLTRLEMGKASALAFILFLICVIANSLVQRLLRKVGN